MSLSGFVLLIFFSTLFQSNHARDDTWGDVLGDLWGYESKAEPRSTNSTGKHRHHKSYSAGKCGAAHYRFGQWIPGADKCGIKSQYDYDLDERCTSPRKVSEKSPHHWADWCWKPAGCISDKFSVKAFCRKLNGRGILIVGDSIQHQFYDALFMQLETKGQPLSQWKVEPNIKKKSSGGICIGHGGGRLIYLRNDQVAVTATRDLDKPVVHGAKATYRADWASVAPMFEIIVLNKGAHFLHDEKQFARDTRDTANWLLKNIDFSRTHIFYRDAPQGHPEATDDTMAITEPLLKNPNWVVNDQYNWSSFPHRNRQAIDIFDSILGPYVTVMHVAHMTHQRPDGHRHTICGSIPDKLHYLLPSVVDSWVQMLFNLIPEVV